MSEGNSFLEEARARAASRAAVLQSLELAYSQPSTANQSQSQRKGPSNQKTDEQSKKSQDPPKQSNKKRPLETAAPAHEESLSSKVQVDVAAKVVVDSLQTQYYTSLALQQNLPTSLQDPFSKRPNYDRMGEFFKDNLQGKAIVLENTASQSKASKTEARLRRYQCQC